MSSPPESMRDWAQRSPTPTGNSAADSSALLRWYADCCELSAELRDDNGDRWAIREQWRGAVRRTTRLFTHAYLTPLRSVAGNGRPEALYAAIQELVPGLMATAWERESDAGKLLEEKAGFEYKDAAVVSCLLGDREIGGVLLETAREPLPSSHAHYEAFRRGGSIDLGVARLRRNGPVAEVEIANAESLNAEDDVLLDALETCVDVALLDDTVTVGTLRGGTVTSAKYRGRRVFCSGINLRELYNGRVTNSYFIRRELGLVSKLQRGLRLPGSVEDREIPWIGVVDSHAIGGGLQLLLVLDYVIAEHGATLSLPAKREGIIPGAANLRLGRFVGESVARRTILFGEALSDADASKIH